MSRSLVVNLFWLAFGILVAATVIGLVTLWPDDGTIERPPELRAPATHAAEVTAIAAAPCPPRASVGAAGSPSSCSAGCSKASGPT